MSLRREWHEYFDYGDVALNLHLLPLRTAESKTGGTWWLWHHNKSYKQIFFTEPNAQTIAILDTAMFTGHDVIFKYAHFVWHVKILEWEYSRDGNIRAIFAPTHNHPIWWEYAYREGVRR